MNRKIDTDNSQTESPRGPRRGRTALAKIRLSSKMFKAMAATALAVAIGLGVTAQPAAAGRYATAGSIGFVVLPTGTCTYRDVWDQLEVKVPAPTIYAPDRNAGGGNDAAWARYRVYVIDQWGNRVRESSFSGWALAYDNWSATFSGGALTFTNIPQYSTVHIGVEWYNIGAAAYSLDRYQLYTKGVGPVGGMSSCSKWTWTA
jgi:hypothetical protein